MSLNNNPHLLLGRIRVLNKCIESFTKSESPPECLCYVPKELCYKICKDSSSTNVSRGVSTGIGENTLISVYESPHSKKLCKYTFQVKKDACIWTTGEEYGNNHGLWVKISKEQLEVHCPGQELEEGWLLVCKRNERGDRLVPVESPQTISRHQRLFSCNFNSFNWWEQMMYTVESTLYINTTPQIPACDDTAVQKLRYIPLGWTFECDEDLIHYLYELKDMENIMMENDDDHGDDGESDYDNVLGCLRDTVRHMEASSISEYSRPDLLTDNDTDTFWESSGKKGQHWLRLHMRRNIVVEKIMVLVNAEDSNFMPKIITIYGGKKHLKKLNEVHVNESFTGEVCVLQDMTCHLPVIEIRIEESAFDGTDVRFRGIKITSSSKGDLGLNADEFQSSYLVRYPRLQEFPPDILYNRASVIQRFVCLMDSVLPYLVPAWSYSLGNFNNIKSAKQFLLLSKCRTDLITQCLKDSETKVPESKPKLSVSRHLAAEHRANPSLDPSCKNALFNQMYVALNEISGLKKAMTYRWPRMYTQWWKCAFISEGIADHGGGFRDSLTDMSEELCPSSAESPLPLPFFIRTSNQDALDDKDLYIPNPSCKDFCKYQWIGQLMGGTFRGKDFLILALPGLVWKQLTGEAVSWSKDFPAVDSALVNLLKAMENMDQETFEFRFGKELVYSTLLSDGQMVDLIPGGSNVSVDYEGRSEFIRLVKKVRLEESKQQIAAMRAGLLKVVPQAVLDLLTWREVERKVCGDPEITIEALKPTAKFQSQEENDVRVQYFWEALTNFTTEDRSRLLKFVTGRSRLPASFWIYFQNPSSEKNDDLPQSSTCGYCLFLPSYPSAQVCEEKLRFAVYNCLTIDSDT